jgi:hypothetical protein
MSRPLAIVVAITLLSFPLLARADDQLSPDRVFISKYSMGFYPSRTKIEAVKRDGAWTVDFRKSQSVDHHRRWRLPWQSEWVLKPVVVHESLELSGEASEKLDALLTDDKLYAEPDLRRACSDVGGFVSVNFMGRARSDDYCQLHEFASAVVGLVSASRDNR